MANLPQGLTVAGLRLRHQKAFAVQSTWQPLLSDAYEFFVPQQNVWRFQNLAPGQRRDTRVLDSTAEDSLDEGASRIKGLVTPDMREWALLTVGNEQPKEVRESLEIQETLKEITTLVFDEVNLSNFPIQSGEAYKDWLIGTAAIDIRENTGSSDSGESILNFHTQNQQLIAYEEGALGNIQNTFKFREIAARSVKDAYPGGDFSQNVKTMAKDSPGSMVKFQEYTMLANGVYFLIVLEDKSEQVVWSEFQGQHNPVVVFRYAVMADEIRGRGPAISQLPNARTLNKIQEFSLQKAAMDLSGMFTAVDDGVLNPNTMQISPGIVVPVQSNASTNPSLLRLDTGSDLNLALFEVDRIESAIKRGLFNDIRDPSDPVLTLGEVQIELQKLLGKMGSSFSRLLGEGLVPILNRVLEIMKRRGRIPDMPSINGREIGVKFTGPLSRAQDLSELDSLEAAVGVTERIAGPEMVHLAFKTEEVGEFAARKTGVDPSLVRSAGERTQKVREAAEAAQAITQEQDVGTEQPA